MNKLEEKCLKGKDLTVNEALDLAGKTGQPIKFNEVHGSEKEGFSASRVGTAWPCGCLQFTTVLTDGSLGWGGWDELCPTHFFDN